MFFSTDSTREGVGFGEDSKRQGSVRAGLTGATFLQTLGESRSWIQV